MPDDHSEVVPLLPIPNRTVKRFCADDSADSRVKVGHRQAIYKQSPDHLVRAFCFAESIWICSTLTTQAAERPDSRQNQSQLLETFGPG